MTTAGGTLWTPGVQAPCTPSPTLTHHRSGPDLASLGPEQMTESLETSCGSSNKKPCLHATRDLKGLKMPRVLPNPLLQTIINEIIDSHISRFTDFLITSHAPKARNKSENAQIIVAKLCCAHENHQQGRVALPFPLAGKLLIQTHGHFSHH